MTKVWCIDVEGLKHDLEFSIYDQHGVDYHFTTKENEIIRDLNKYGATVEAVQVQVGIEITEEMMSQMPNLKGICTFGMGFNNVDLLAASERNISVSNVPDYSTGEVADHTVTLALAAIRDIKRFDKEVTEKEIWNPTMNLPIRRLSEMTFGIFGFGKIAREVSQRLKGFGFKIIAHDPYVNQAVYKKYGVQEVSFEELIQESDILSLHTPLTKETQNKFTKDEFSKFKKGIILINTARAEIIDQSALIAAIQDGTVARAGIDVLETEPPKERHPLMNFESVILTPHVAYLSQEAEVDLQTKTAMNILRILNNEEPHYQVNKLLHES